MVSGKTRCAVNREPYGVIIVDDSISHKPHMDENEIVGWYYDHTSDKCIKGINIVSVMYHSEGLSIPVSFTIVKKEKMAVDSNTGKEKRVSTETKNEHCGQCSLTAEKMCDFVML